MLRDPAPRQNIGFGVPPLDPGEQEGSGGNSIISKYLDQNPLVRYLGTAAASIVSMSVAGAMVRRGGLAALAKVQAQALNNPQLAARLDSGVRSFRKVEQYLDELQGVTRTYDPDEAFVIKDNRGRLARSGRVVKTDGYSYRVDNPELGPWGYRDAIQQRIVAQARRLPYELPGFYAADKLILDPLLGTDQGERPTSRVLLILSVTLLLKALRTLLSTSYRLTL